MSIINIHSNVLIFDDNDDVVTSNPKRRNTDWTVDISGVKVSDPESKSYTIAPGDTSTIFSGERTLTVDNTTVFSVSLNPVSDATYRLTNTSGTAPGFRTDRVILLNTKTVNVAVNNNATVEFTVTGTPDFTGVVAGDIVFIPDTTTGDSASPFNVLNVGFWVVLANTASNKKLVCKRIGTADFQGVSETVVITANAQFLVFSSAGVQVGDTLSLMSGFSSITLASTYQIQAVTPLWIEFGSTVSLPLETGVSPTASGIAIYSSAKNFVRVEVDRESVIRLNADSSNNTKLSPREQGTKDGVAYLEMWGNVYKMVIVNKSDSDPLKAIVISAIKST